jgi:hypothetical protein
MNFLIIVVVTVLAQLLAPWWVIALVPFLVFAWRPVSGPQGFGVSFAAVGLAWLVYGGWLHSQSQGSMSNRIAELFSLPNGVALLAVVTLIGGLVAGLSGLSGCYFGQIFNKK